MPLHIVVTAKQVIDPEMPRSALRLDDTAHKVVTPATLPPVVNGFDEHAVEAALRIKEKQDAHITVLSVGGQFALDIMKKPLAMGADALILCQDPLFTELSDSFVTAQVLGAALRKIGNVDLILCGRQASDWDNAQVPLLLAELLNMPCISLAQKVEVEEGKVIVEHILPDGTAVVEAPLPALVTVSNELGEPRYPNMRNIMAANRKRPTVWKSADLGLEPTALTPRLEVVELSFPSRTQQCEFIEADTPAAVGEKLALTLRQAGLI